MIRWKYLIPRFLIFCLIASAFWLSKDAILKWCLIQSGQATIGAKVEIGGLTSSLTNGEINLTELEIADPRNPMSNLIQADHAKIKLDPRRLFHREFVIDEGSMTGVQFGTPRTDSGELPDKSSKLVGPEIPDDVKNQLIRFGESWLDQFHVRLQNNLDENFETVRVAKQIKQFYPAEFQRQRQRALQLQAKIKSLKQIIETPPKNPLRDGQRIAKAIADLENVRKEIVAAHEELKKLSERAVSDQNALLAARDRDEQRFKTLVKLSKVDNQSASELLLGQKQAEYLSEMLGWIEWIRSTVPNPETDFVPQRGLGTQVQFAGIQQRPGVVLRKLHLDGSGHFAGQHYQFVGEANNLTSAPALHDEPATFAFAARGNHQVHIHATVDRRSDEHYDELTIRCPRVAMPQQFLGDEQALMLNMQPSQLSADINVKMVDDRIEGQMVFYQSNVDLHVEHLHRLVGGPTVAQSINEELAGIENFKVVVDLSGTIDAPQAQLNSDLGDKVAGAMNAALKNAAQQAVAKHSIKLHGILDQELAELKREINNNSQEILVILREEVSHISRLQEIVPDLNSWNPIR